MSKNKRMRVHYVVQESRGDGSVRVEPGHEIEIDHPTG